MCNLRLPIAFLSLIALSSCPEYLGRPNLLAATKDKSVLELKFRVMQYAEPEYEIHKSRVYETRGDADPISDIRSGMAIDSSLKKAGGKVLAESRVVRGRATIYLPDKKWMTDRKYFLVGFDGRGKETTWEDITELMTSNETRSKWRR